MAIGLPTKPVVFRPTHALDVLWGHPLAQGIVGGWMFQEGAGRRVANIIPDALPGTFVANDSVTYPTWTVLHRPQYGGRAIQNQTQSYISVGNYALLNPPRITVHAWFYRTSTTSGEPGVTKRHLGNNSNNFFLGTGSNPAVGMFSFIAYTSAGTLTAESVTNFTTNAWHQVVGTYDGSNARLWVDRVNTATTPGSGTLNGNTFPNLVIGSDFQVAGYWNGRIASVVIWNRALSPAEIVELYTNPHAFLAPPSTRRYFITGLLQTPVSRDDVIPWEALGVLAPDRVLPFESLGPAIAGRILPWECSGALEADRVLPFEGLSLASTEHLIPWETLGTLVVDGIAPFENSSPTLLNRLVPWESLSEQLGDPVVPWDATSPAVFQNAIVPWDALAPALGDLRALWEALGLGTADRVEPWESLGIGFADRLIPLEALGVAAIDRRVLWELLGAAAADHTIPFEVLGLGTVDRVALWESLGVGVSDRVILWETLGVLGRDRIVPWEALGTTAADRIIPYEALEALAQDVQLPWGALAAVFGGRLLLVEVLAVVIGNNIIPLSAGGSVLGDREIPWEARGVNILIRISDVAMAGGTLLNETVGGPTMADEAVADPTPGSEGVV